MKRVEAWEVNGKDKKLIQILQDLGYSRGFSKVVVYFFFFKKGLSSEIERTMNMRQPEVSVSIHELLKQNCLECTQIQPQGRGNKGRPRILYSLKKEPADILECIEKEVQQKIDKQVALLKELKECIAKQQ